MIDQPGGVGGNVLVVQMMQSSTGYDGIVLRQPGNARQCVYNVNNTAMFLITVLSDLVTSRGANPLLLVVR